jgi:hypothetical protein
MEKERKKNMRKKKKQRRKKETSLSSVRETLTNLYLLVSFRCEQAPCDPVDATTPETLEKVAHLSLNFFYVNPLLHMSGIKGADVIPDIAVHPAEEALFNLANAWSMM